MSTEITKDTFESIYKETYNNVLKFVLCHCNNIDDVNDIIQDIYADLYKTVCKKTITLDNPESYLISIAKNKVKRNYKEKLVNVSLDNEVERVGDISLDIEIDFITKENVLKVWNYLKLKGDLTANIFYLFYIMELPIKDIAKELNITESNVKNYLYRTKKELKETFMKGGDSDA